jgi:hypothetical protein
MDIDDIIEEALGPLGGEHTSGITAARARLKLNLVLLTLQNQNIPLSKLDTIEQAFTASTGDYLLDRSVSDILELTVLKTGETTRIPLTRIALREFELLPNRTQTGRPTTYAVERLKDQVNLKLWPLPDASTYTANMLVSKYIEDVSASYQKLDLPARYYPLVIAMLSYGLSKDRQGIPMDVKQSLKQDMLELMPDTFMEDSERTDLFVTIGGLSGR